MECVLSKCPNPECTCVPADNVESVMNQLSLVMRKHIQTYYQVGCSNLQYKLSYSRFQNSFFVSQ